MASESRAARVFLYDARLVLALANHGRYLALHRIFGVSRGQANLLTGVLLIGAAETTAVAARRMLHPRLDGTAASVGALAVREAALAVGGPGARQIRGFGPLVGLALIGGVAVPSLTRAARGVRAAEAHLRERRMRAFAAMRTAVG
jgi:hypothetical protein